MHPTFEEQILDLLRVMKWTVLSVLLTCVFLMVGFFLVLSAG
jgi:hypothetical protein